MLLIEEFPGEGERMGVMLVLFIVVGLVGRWGVAHGLDGIIGHGGGAATILLLVCCCGCCCVGVGG